MDDLPNDIDRSYAEQQTPEIENGFAVATVAICNKCNAAVNIKYPSICACGDIKHYWKTFEGKILDIRKMDLGHLSNSIRYLADIAEKYPANLREPFEIALDILYAELGSREKETAQITGIQAALFRAISK